MMQGLLISQNIRACNEGSKIMINIIITVLELCQSSGVVKAHSTEIINNHLNYKK